MTTDTRHVSHWEAVSTSRLVPASCELCAAMDFEHRWWHVLQVADCHGKEIWQPLGSTDVPGLVAKQLQLRTSLTHSASNIADCVSKKHLRPTTLVHLGENWNMLVKPKPKVKKQQGPKTSCYSNVYFYAILLFKALDTRFLIVAAAKQYHLILLVNVCNVTMQLENITNISTSKGRSLDWWPFQTLQCRIPNIPLKHGNKISVHPQAMANGSRCHVTCMMQTSS